MTEQQLIDMNARQGIVESHESAPNGKLAFLERAIERGGAEEAGKLVDLYERLTKLEGAKAYNRSMARVQKLIPAIVKWKQSENSYYAPIEDVLKVARPIWLEEGFTVSADMAESNLAEHYRIVLHISHSEGETRHHFMDLPADNKGPKGAPNKTLVHGVASSFTYGERILTCRVFNIVLEGLDQDGRVLVRTLNEEEQATIDTLLEGVSPDQLKRILAWAEAPDRTRIPASKFADLMRWLKKIREGGQS